MAFEDIIGADLALGDEVATLSPSIVKAMAGHQEQVLRALAERNASALVERKPQKSREFPLGFPETRVAGNGGTEDIVAFPQIGRAHV